MEFSFKLLLLSFTFISMAYSQEIKLFHYNIKELDSEKIQTIKGKAQLESVATIMARFDFDIVSLNEIQYDLPNVPSKEYTSHGQNLDKLQKILNITHLTNKTFNIANTGIKAKTKADGTYFINPNSQEARHYADKVNFGTMPGQYSSGALFKFKKINEIVINNLIWKDFNPQLDLTSFTDDTGKPLPNDMALFDKNFTDVILDVNGKELHLIILHTVPAYHFGNLKSVNSFRNGDQLKFLEWYLTGSTDFKVSLNQIKPLNPNDYFLAVGDWNTEYANIENSGSLVLRRLFSKIGLWIDPQKLTYTNESNGFKPNPNKLMLDYIAHSKNIEVMDAKIIHPINSAIIDIGCDGTRAIELIQDFVVVDYQLDGKTCKSAVHKDYVLFKEASDHYPIWGHFKLK